MGHSLGGLVAKAASVVTLPSERAGGTSRPGDGSKRLANPRVARVIFVATPHRGAPMDQGIVRSVGAYLARSLSPSLVARRAVNAADASCTPTSIDQLTWDHPLLADLERARMASGIASHSIIAALKEPSAAEATDGLVPVVSARLRDATSEIVIQGPHACFQHAQVIREVQRILKEHAAAAGDPARPVG